MDVILFGTTFNYLYLKAVLASFDNVSIFFLEKKIARPNMESFNFISKFIGKSQFGQHKLDV